MNFENYLTWQGVLDICNEKIDETETEEYIYPQGKCLILMVLFNKCLLFFTLTIFGILVLHSMYVSKQWLRSLVLLLLFDIFIDETIICTPLCRFLDAMKTDMSYLKMNMSLCIEITDKPTQLDIKQDGCSSCSCQQKNIIVETDKPVENLIETDESI